LRESPEREKKITETSVGNDFAARGEEQLAKGGRGKASL